MIFALGYLLVSLVIKDPFELLLFAGVPKTRWKQIQISGRLARRPEDNAVFITVAPKRHAVRGADSQNKYKVPK